MSHSLYFDMCPEINIKGIREGLLVTIGEGSWDDSHQCLLEQLDQQGEFLRGARLALDVGNHPLKATHLSKVRDEIPERDLILWAVLSSSPLTEQTAQTLGLATRLSKPIPDEGVKRLDTALYDGEEAILVQRTLRSGYNLTYPGHIVVFGDVNPGAEVIASGTIIVWGRLRGLVHAGAEGDKNAYVCALDLRPTQLRIAGQIALVKGQQGKHPEKALLKSDQVVIEPWKKKSGK